MRVLIIASASVSIYKSCELVRLFKKNGHYVNVILTPNASEFISENIFGAISDGVFVYETAAMEHISLVRNADAIIVAPASAAFIGNAANGIGGSLALDALLAKSPDVPTYIAPAMNCEMWNNNLVQENIQKLQAHGFSVINPQEGDLACGENGAGKLAEPADIYSAVMKNMPLCGVKVLITAGGTIERIDDVRYISNFSSGIQAEELVNVFAALGAIVTVIAGNTKCSFKSASLVIHVESADQMLEAALLYKCDVFIAAAAVGDFKPSTKTDGKIKKSDILTIDLTHNADILKSVSTGKDRPRIVIGFAAESENLLENAMKKKVAKNCDILIGNELVFGSNDTRGFIISESQERFDCTKAELARKVASTVLKVL